VVAIKKMKQKYTNWNECIELREIKSLRKLNHSNIIKLKEVLLVAEELYMVFEYLEYNLYEVYSKMKEENKKFTEKEIKYVCFKAGT
jgi:serine/threonine protein kinase